MADIPVTEFNITSISKAYMQYATEPLLISLLAISVFWGEVMAIKRFLKEYWANLENGRLTNTKRIYSHLWQLLFTTSILLMMPVALSFFEYILNESMQELIFYAGGEPKGGFATIVKEIEDMEERYPEGPSFFFDSLPDLLAWFNIIVVKPAIAVLIRWEYGLFLAGRFYWLILLEIVFPFAWLSLASEDSSQYFYTWLLNLFKCYLLMPAFVIAIGFADVLMITVFGDPYSLLALILQLIVKFYLLKRATEYVFKLF
ncbi:hypothetical protein LX64_05165 [Chitinophaga skermanii]|uniref:Uncharacterized protein n=1 Tax=Chitinophaga skermanii TaxID=331697 RepID=A0A327PXI6_9BACT|nr:hypothetical protein [Chitinophaga skermanii]RAI97020.1 hypothetical protein LX64_05165 [Chitinophaga skermanii]